MTNGKMGKRSLREALLTVLEQAEQPLPANDLIAQALEQHPLPGKTPRATAAAQLTDLVKAGTLVRPRRGVYALPATNVEQA
jgi:hypothetical protein